MIFFSTRFWFLYRYLQSLWMTSRVPQIRRILLMSQTCWHRWWWSCIDRFISVVLMVLFSIIPRYLFTSLLSSALMVSLFDNTISLDAVVLPFLIVNLLHLSCPKSIRMSSLYSQTTSKSNSSLLSLFAYSFRSSMKRRWFGLTAGVFCQLILYPIFVLFKNQESRKRQMKWKPDWSPWKIPVLILISSVVTVLLSVESVVCHLVMRVLKKFTITSLNLCISNFGWASRVE